MLRIGVFVCHCGSNIAATVDVKKVVEMALHEPAWSTRKIISICVPKPGRRRSGRLFREALKRHCGVFLFSTDA